jgi:hypothetical protein
VANGAETPRIRVTLATSIPESSCRELNLSYLDYRTVNLEHWKHREDEGIKLIPHAGEILFRLKDCGNDAQTASLNHAVSAI